ncbi:MAG TPA: insulinase family protein [Geminicoccus sp.]|jgi:zinc protease|uniref:M16 family metallopeptidase n=1 Tax=Geminicoccus sp. TaxID=2024832 RepID=UPI002E31A8EE|nr:insulinase family protein [Geminicoccus sp.]HEX2527212.1 insulinase family protein [Geminicoccus sp.]
MNLLILTRTAAVQGTSWTVHAACRLVAVLVLVLVAVSAQASDPEPWPRTGEPPLVVDPTVTWGSLPNGLRYVIMPNRTPPGRVSLRLLVEAGSLMEREDQRGLAHFLEHMAFKGSKNVQPGEFVRFLQRQGMAFGADTNARTGFDSTVYMLELPGNGAELVDSGLFMLSEVAGNLTFPPAEIDTERGVIESERRLRNTPFARQTDAMLAFMLDGTLYPDRLPIGDEQVIRTADQADFEAFYRANYRTDRMVMVVAGDVEPQAVEPILQKHFGQFAKPDAPFAAPDLGQLDHEGADALYFMDPGLPTTVALMRSKPEPQEPDSLERVDRRLVDHLANMMLSRRLQSRALTPGAVFTDGDAWSAPMEPMARISGVTLQTTPEQWEQALTVAEQELRRVLQFGFSQQELETAIGILRSDFQARLAASMTVESARQAEALVATIMDEGVFTSAQSDLDLLERTAATVTPERALEALKAAWGADEPKVMLTGSFPLENTRERILSVYQQSRAVEVKPPEQAALPPFAYQDFGTPGTVTGRETIQDLGISSLQFANGVQLDMKPTKLEADRIQVAVRFGSGVFSMPKDQPGLSMLAKAGFIAGGLGRHDIDQIERIFAAKQVGVDLQPADTSFVLTGSTTRTDLPDQLRLMAAYLTDPAFNPDALVRFRQAMADTYRAMDATPSGQFSGPVALLIHDGDPRFALPPEQEIAERTLDELRTWMEPGLKSGPLQVVLVGDIERETATKLVAETFGALPDRGQVDPVQPPTIRLPSRAEPVEFYHHGQRDQAISTVFWPTTDSRDRRRDRGLDILADIFSDRLLQAVRDAEGASYSPEVSNGSSATLPGFGYLAASVDLQTDHARETLQETVDIARGLREEGVTADELERAVKPRLAEVEAVRQSNRWWAYAVLLGMHQFPDRLEAVRTAKADLSAHTVGSINDLARQYLVNDRALRVLILPAPTE